MASTFAATAPIDRSPAGERRVDAAFLVVAAFLAVEPLVRALVWWRLDDLRASYFLRTDVVWLALATLGLLGASTLGRGYERVRRHGWLVPLGCLWAAAAVLSSANALMPQLAGERSLRWVLMLAFALSLLAAVRARPERAFTLLLGWSLGLCGYAAVLVAFVLVDPVRPGVDWVTHIPGVANVRHLGFEAMTVALVGSLYRPAAAHRVWTGALLLAGAVGWTLLFWSGGRGSFLAAGAALVAVAVLGRSDRRRRFVELVCLMLAGFAIATVHTPSGPSFGAWRTIGATSVAPASGAPEAGDVSSGRLDMWREAAAAVAAHPWLGIGEAHAPLRLETARGFAQPHNLFLQAALAWGVVGGAAFVIAIAYSLWRAARRVSGSDLGSPAAAGFAVAVALAANALIDGTLFHPRPVTLFLIGLCLALGSSRSAGEAGPAGRAQPSAGFD